MASGDDEQLGLELFTQSEDLRADLVSVDLPVTVIVGSEDESSSSQAAELAALTGGELVVIEGAHHSPQLSHGKEWLTAVAGHVDRTA